MSRFLMILLSLAAISGAPARSAEATDVEVRAVGASEPGAKPVKIPASLSKYKKLLITTNFGNFTDAGLKSIRLKTGEKGSVVVSGYNLELSLLSRGRKRAVVEVTIKEGDKAIGTPLRQTLSETEPAQIELGHNPAPTIIFLSLKEE